MAESIGSVVLKQGGDFPLIRFIWKYSMCTQHSQLDSIPTLNRFICSKNTTNPATGTKAISHYGQYGLVPF